MENFELRPIPTQSSESFHAAPVGFSPTSSLSLWSHNSADYQFRSGSYQMTNEFQRTQSHAEDLQFLDNIKYENEKKPMKKKGEKQSRREKYAFQTRSHVDILDDGYRWRKYGQKAVKSHKFPRSYYRCTHQGCGVKKQVQRFSKDEGIVVTTYEGVHTHPIEKSTDNFDQILKQMQIYPSF